MPVFRFNRGIRLGNGVKAFLGLDEGVARGAKPEADPPDERTERPQNARRRISELKRSLRSKRRGLAPLARERHAAKRGLDSARIEHIKRVKIRKQEIFRLKHELRSAKLGVESASVTGALPDFVVIGAPKCGTTFFYHLLTKHPHVEPAAFKELHFFDLLFDQGTEWYRQCFVASRQKDGRKTITGEGTPSYLFHPLVAERMAEVVPRARLIALLRDPVDRTYSAYQHWARNREQPRTFEENVEAAFDFPNQGFLSRSVYVDHLLRWSRFYSREQMLVLKSEGFFEYPRETLRLVLDFLDLPDWEPRASELRDRVNKGGYEQRMDPATKQRLEEYFEPHNHRLYEYLGADFGW